MSPQDEIGTRPTEDRPPDEAPPPAGNGFSRLGQSPVHFLSAVVMLTTDKLWETVVPEWLKPLALTERLQLLALISLLIFLVCGLSVMLIQYCVVDDRFTAACAKGVALGILAGIPYAVGTTEMGLIFVAWSGLNELQKQGKQ